jgi:hypothetical protein
MYKIPTLTVEVTCCRQNWIGHRPFTDRGLSRCVTWNASGDDGAQSARLYGLGASGLQGPGSTPYSILLNINLDSISYYTPSLYGIYSLLLLGYKPVQHVTVLNTVGNCNTVAIIIILYYNLMGTTVVYAVRR